MTATPKLTTYRIFAALDAGDTMHPGEDNEHVLTEQLWEPLGTVEAADQDAAMDAAIQRVKSKRTVDDGTITAVAAVVNLTVAAVSERNWREGTARITIEPVTTWVKA